jgi:uncharacterized protein YjbJ (UPF0337 family)
MDTMKNFLPYKWYMLKSEVRKHWVKITEDDLKKLNGNTEDLINVLRKRYGYGKAQAEIEINTWLVEQNQQREKHK